MAFDSSMALQHTFFSLSYSYWSDLSSFIFCSCA